MTNSTLNRKHELEGDRIIILRQLMPLQDLEWWEPENITPKEKERLADLRSQLAKVNAEYVEITKR
jgi:hypothetical protein